MKTYYKRYMKSESHYNNYRKATKSWLEVYEEEIGSYPKTVWFKRITK